MLNSYYTTTHISILANTYEPSLHQYFSILASSNVVLQHISKC